MAKKKTRSPRQAPSASEAHERRQQRLQARREAKAQALEAQRKAQRRARWLRIGGLAVGSVAVLALLWRLAAPPDTPDRIRGHSVRKLGESGTGDHTTAPVRYDSTPPTHGPHEAQPAPCGVHPEPVPEGNQVHSLEHGAVGIQYRPDLVEVDDIRAIERLTRGFDSGVFSAPYPEMEPAIAVSSWGELMELDSLDMPAIREYIEVFRGQGPEDVSCDNLVDDPFEPEEEPAGRGGGG